MAGWTITIKGAGPTGDGDSPQNLATAFLTVMRDKGHRIDHLHVEGEQGRILTEHRNPNSPDDRPIGAEPEASRKFAVRHPDGLLPVESGTPANTTDEDAVADEDAEAASTDDDGMENFNTDATNDEEGDVDPPAKKKKTIKASKSGKTKKSK